MKIPESELRKIVRAQLLAERFETSSIMPSAIEACKINIPAGYNAESIEVMANDALNIYGMPGSICDLINALIPDKKRGSGSSRRGSTASPERPEAVVLLASVSEALEDVNVLFVEGIDPVNPTQDQVSQAQNDYETKLAELDRKVTETQPKEVAKFIVEDIFSRNGDLSDVRRKIGQVSDQDDTSIVRTLVGEARRIMQLEASRNIQMRISSASAGSDARLALEAYKNVVITS